MHEYTEHESWSDWGQFLISMFYQFIAIQIHNFKKVFNYYSLLHLHCNMKNTYHAPHKIFDAFYPLPYGMLWSFLQLPSTAKSTDVFFLEIHWVVCSKISNKSPTLFKKKKKKKVGWTYFTKQAKAQTFALKLQEILALGNLYHMNRGRVCVHAQSTKIILCHNYVELQGYSMK